MEIIKLAEENIHDEHICCAISDKKCVDGYEKKKEWLKKEFRNGYNFQKVNVRGKVFIEYVPIENSWLPITGKNFMVVNCFWVSGQFKGKGNGKKLLEQCLTDSKEMDGIIAVSSDKKRPFMTDPKFLKHQGFEIIDEAEPYFKLWGLKINPKAEFPKFIESSKSGKCPNSQGITAYYSNTCPFTEYYTNRLLREYAKKKNIPLEINQIKSQEDGRRMPIPWVINSVFYKGELVSLEMKVERHLEKLIG
ncbi:YoaP domain-containing protein [Maribacter polysiphoniae]|uniref:YoaP domain-containing protein n=1 Tax=Maribacter polysiphoniae TaxID=429344 RepID=A0A316DJS9_9FLAO|nr:YoaP domain-containing protein [Maribacter polysiphoniae]MBD1263171.1 YoaP domain-containing protein [Maribacter polysiphoniae]PWK18464.1 YoaP-like protein [Maribacter polysiphoniae]